MWPYIVDSRVDVSLYLYRIMMWIYRNLTQLHNYDVDNGILAAKHAARI